eukprot:jgi/Hompol1/4168/HPOL_006957-RA
MTTTSQLKEFAAKIGGLQQQRTSLNLPLCNGASGNELESIEDMINRQAPIATVLRVLCLYCLVSSGIKPKYFDTLRRSIVQTYGYAHILTLQHLQQAGLLFVQDPASYKNTYPQIVKQMQLLTDYDSDLPADVSYVYHGYAPISMRLVQAACRSSSTASDNQASVTWKGCEDMLRLFPATQFFEETLTSTDRSFRK